MSTKKETERSKLVQEKCQNLITVMLKDEDNKYCVDCDAKGPRWASWNLGVFLCIRCAGIHRNLGVHITRVKSVNLDTWTPEQVASLQHMGNSRARAVYEAQLPDGFRRPQTDAALESFIRAKYEQKKYVAKEWVPSPAPKVDWEKEIDEELEKQKRKKKSLAAAGGGSAILGTISSPSVEKKPSASKPTPIPAPLPKPKSSGHSPKTGRAQLELSNASAVLASPTTTVTSSNTLDLLGLSSPPPPAKTTSTTTTISNCSSNAVDDLSSNGGAASDDEFNNFFSANSQARQQQQMNKSTVGDASKQATNTSSSSLAQEEADFFNQSVPSESEKAKLTKDSIMALYGRLPSGAVPVQQQQPTPQANANAPTSNVNLLAGLGVGFPGQMTQQINGGFPTQVPNGNNGNGSNGGHPFGGLVNLHQQQQGQGQVFGQQGQGQQQFGMQQVPVQMPSQFMNGGGGGFYHNGTGGGIMGGVGSTVQGQVQQQGMNFFPANGQMGGFNNNQQQMMGGQQPGKGFNGNGVGQQQQGGQFPQFGGPPGGQMMQPQNQSMMMGQQGMTLAGGVNGSNGGAAMQKQFGNLNLGNVWQ